MSCIYKYKGKDYTKDEFYSLVRTTSNRDLKDILLQRNETNKIIGQANINALEILIDAVNQKQDTLPHEYAHFYIAWNRNTPIVQEAIKKWGSEEALVQAIGEQAVKQEGEAWSWWKKFVNWFLGDLSKLKNLDKEQLKNILTDAFLTRQDLTINLESIDNSNFNKEISDKNETKSFTEKDYSFVKENLFHKTLGKLFSTIKGGKIELNSSLIIRSLKDSFSETINELQETNLDLETQYLLESKELLLGQEGEYLDSVLEDIFDMYNISEEEVDDADLEDVGENTTGYDQSSYEKSAILSTSQKMKTFFSSIVDDNYKGEGFGTLEKYVDPNTVIAGIQKVFSLSVNNSIESFKQVSNNLIAKSTNKEGKSPYSFLKEVIRRIEDPSIDESFVKELQYTFYQNPVKMTFVQVEPMIMKDGSTRFIVKALDADSKNESILKRAEWVNNFKQSPLIDMLDSKSFKVDKTVADRVKSLYGTFIAIEDKTTIRPEDLKEYFNYFGINLHDTSIELILSGTSSVKIQDLVKGLKKDKKGRDYATSTIDTLYLNLQKALIKQEDGQILDASNYSKDNLLLWDTTNFIKDLIDLDNNVTFNPAISNHIGGKTVNSYANPNLITEQIKKLKNENDETLINNLSEASFSKETMVVQMIKEYPKLKKLIDVDQVSLSAIKEKGESVSDKNRIEDLSIRDYFVTTIANFTQTYFRPGISRNGIDTRISKMPFPTISDNGTMPLLKTVVYNLLRNNFVNNIEDEVILKDEVLQELFGQLVQPEINRIEAFIKNEKVINKDISGLDFKSKLFYILPSFNSVLVKDKNDKQVSFLEALTSAISSKESIEDLITKNKKVLLGEVNSAIKTITDELFRVEEGIGKGVLVEQGIFKNGDLGVSNGTLEAIDSMYLEEKRGESKGLNNLTQSQLTQLVTTDYVVNYLVNQQTIQALFAGDLINYSKAKSDMFVNGDTSSINFGSKSIKGIIGDVKLNNTDYNAGQEYKTAIYNQIAKNTGVNLSKRLKALLSPGNRLATEEKDYLQIIIQDTDSSSEVLESLFRTWYPEDLKKELKDKLIEFKKLDSIYDKSNWEKTEHKKMLDDFQKNYPLIADYFSNKTADGQEWVTWQDSLSQLKSQGRITEDEYITVYNKLNNQSKNGVNKENKLTKEEMKIALMQPSKPLYSGLHFEKYGDFTSQRFVYVKSSSFPLLPELTLGFKLDNVRKNLEKFQDQYPNYTVRASFDSAVKSGNFNNPLNIEELYRNEESLNFDLLKEKSIILNKDNFSIQQDKPFKTDKNIKTGKRDEISRGTQPEKIILGNGINKIEDKIFPNLFDKNILEAVGVPSNQESVSGADLWNIYNELYRQEQNFLKTQLFKELGIKSYEDLSKKEPMVYEKLSSILNSRLSNKQDKESVSIVYKVANEIPIEGEPGKTQYINRRTVNKVQLQKIQETESNVKILNADFKLPIWVTPNSRKFESVLGAIIKNNLTKPKLPGSSSAVASEEGFRINNFEEYIKNYGSEGIVFTDSFDGILKAKRNEDGSIKAAQVLLPNKFRGTDGKLIDLTKYVKDGVLDNEKFPKELREFFSYRIPTSAHQSGMLIEVVGFLPHNSGDMMVVPKDSTVQIGEDYDIDMRNWYILNYKEENGTLRKLDASDSVSPEDIEKMKEEHERNRKELINSIEDKKYKLWYNNREHLIELAFLLEEKQMLLNSDTSITKLIDDLLTYDSGETQESDTVGELQDINQKIIQLEEIIIPTNTIKEKQEELRKEMISVLKELDNNFSKEKKNLYLKMKKNEDIYHKVLENNIISIYKAVYSASDTRIDKLISATLNTKFAEKTADLIEEATQNSNKDTLFTLYSPTYQQRVMTLGHAGQIGVGVHSNWVVFNSLIQQVSNEENPIQLIDTDEDGTQKPFYMQFGVMNTNGILGKEKAWGEHGRQLAVINMENQNAAVDNQKLLIMGKRNENAHTISVFALMENLGLDNDGIKIDGQEYSYASLFIAQPILRRYAELMDYFNSPTVKTYENVNKLVKEKLIEEFGREVSWSKTEEGEFIKGTLDKEVKYGNEKKNTFGMVDNLTSENLYNQLTSTGGDFQWTVFEHFLQLSGRLKEVNNLQQMLNIESKGIGLSFFDTIDIKNNLLSTLDINNKISNASTMIGDFKYLSSKEDSTSLEKEGYIYIDTKEDGNMVFIKPETFFGHKVVNTIATGYNLWKNVMPYESKYIDQQIKEIFNELKIKEDTKAGREYKVKIMQAMKDYMFLHNQQLFKENGESVESNRKKLFIDTEDNISLPSFLNELKRTNHPLMEDAFFKNLEFEINKNDEPSIMKYNISDSTKLIKNQAYRTLKNLVNNSEIISEGFEIGGKILYQNYTKGNLVKDLLKYALIADQANGAIGFRQHLPLSLFDEITLSNGEKTNITKSLRVLANTDSVDSHNVIYNGDVYSLSILMGSSISEEGTMVNNNNLDEQTLSRYVQRINKHLGENVATILKDKSVSIPSYSKENLISNFVRQYVQHNSQDIKSLSKTDSDKLKNGLPKEFKKDLSKVLQISLSENYENRKFITVKDKNSLYLFENTGGSSFKRINTLGTFGMNEYETGSKVEKSLVKSNNISTDVEKPFTPSPKRFKIKGVEIDSKKTENAYDIVSQIGNSNSKYKNLANLLLRYLPKDIILNYTDKLEEIGYNGLYVNGTIFISDNIDKNRQEEAVLEEILHKLTVAILSDYLKVTPNGKTVVVETLIDNPITTKLASVYKAGYETIYKNLVDKFGVEKTEELLGKRDSDVVSKQGLDENANLVYRALSVEEFIAGIFFDKNFAEILNNTEYKKTGESITENFIKALLRLFKTIFPEMNLNDNSILKETSEVLVELLENSYKENIIKQSKDTIVNESMLSNDKEAKALLSMEVVNPYQEDESKRGLFDDIIKGSPSSMKKLDIVKNKNIYDMAGLLFESGKRRFYPNWKSSKNSTSIVEQVVEKRNKDTRLNQDYYFVVNGNYVDIYEKTYKEKSSQLIKQYEDLKNKRIEKLNDFEKLQKQGNYIQDENGDIVPYFGKPIEKGITYNDINNIDVFC